MQSAGGGWTLLTGSYASTLTTINSRNYLYTFGGRWYQSPRTTVVWSYTTGFTLVGQYLYSSPALNGSFHCSGSAEVMGFGVGCSMGGGLTTLKVLVQTAPNAALAQGIVCQDVPNIFGSNCVTAQFWERATSYSVPQTCQAIQLANPASPSGNYFIDPDGISGGLAPFSVYCEMSLNGGGYTQLIPSVVSTPLFQSRSARVYFYTFNVRILFCFFKLFLYLWVCKLIRTIEVKYHVNFVSLHFGSLMSLGTLVPVSFLDSRLVLELWTGSDWHLFVL